MLLAYVSKGVIERSRLSYCCIDENRNEWSIRLLK